MSNRFTKYDELIQVDLGDGDWVKIPSRFSFDFIEKYANFDPDGAKNNMEQIGTFLCAVVKDWNLKDKEDKKVPVTEAAIRDLDLDTAMQVVNASMDLFKTLPKG